MKILVTGSEGQVARSLAERSAGHELHFAARPDFDLGEPRSIEKAIAEIRPEIVISAAAYTQVDQAEEELELAMRINGEAPGHIGRAAASVGASVIHLSTDYVFDGSGENAWREEDRKDPINAYGATKLAGELSLTSSGANYAIMRTAWVYSPFGNNFVKTMLRLAANREEINVVSDQFGNPTSALDIADAIMAIVDRWQSDPTHGVCSAYHFAGRGSANWADFATRIFQESSKRGGPRCAVKGIESSDFPTKARRPGNSRLDCEKFKLTFGQTAPEWSESLAETVGRLLGSEQVDS